jgi:K+-transporting ATPase KdpF subunit
MSPLPRSGSSCCGGSRSRSIGSKRAHMFDYIVSAIVALLLLAYLGWAMFQPERF